jgi:peptidoglycan/LPS O-acetylase OafA/YrhL
MRGIAALVVLALHSFQVGPDTPRCLSNAFLAVDFFFILSGFVICHAYGEKLARGMMFRDYLVRRVSRLYPLMIIGLLLGAPLLAQLTMAHPGAFTAGDFGAMMIGNAFMLPNLTQTSVPIPGVFPTDNALWSIDYEILASASFPLFLVLDRTRLQIFCVGWLAILFISAFLRGSAIHGHPFFDMDAGWDVENFFGGLPRAFFGFSCGVLLYRLRPSATHLYSKVRPARPYLLYIGLLVMLLVPITLRGVYPLFATAILAPVLVCLGSASPCRGLTARLSEFLGWLSYPLYCVHTPVVWLIHNRTDLFGRFGVPEQVAAVVSALGIAVMVGLLNDKLELQRRLARMPTMLTQRVQPSL